MCENYQHFGCTQEFEHRLKRGAEVYLNEIKRQVNVYFS